MRIFTLYCVLLFVAAPCLLGACSSQKKGYSVAVSDRHPVSKPQTIEGIRYEPDDVDYADARELKLKARELAEQLVVDMKDCSLQGSVALPTSFVNLDDFRETSAFGRLVGEQLYFELNQRGYPVREYRINGSIRPRVAAGEFALSRNLGKVMARYPGSVIILGTYSQAPNAVFVNARLVRPSDGRVLRTANMVIESNPTIQRLLQRGRSGAGMMGGKLAEGTMRIRDFDNAKQPPAPQNLTPFDQGQDIH